MTIEDRLAQLGEKVREYYEPPAPELLDLALQLAGVLRESEAHLTGHKYECKWTHGGDRCTCGFVAWDAKRRALLDGEP